MKTVDIPTEDVDDGTPVETPVKKLRQALLPFQIVSSVGVSSTPLLSSKKRKLTEESSNCKITKNIRLEKQTETKENMVMKPHKHDVSNISQSSDENLCKSVNDAPVEEESLCLHLDEETNPPKSECTGTSDSKELLKKKEEKESSSPIKEREDMSATENEEIIDSMDEVQVVSNTSIDLLSTDEDDANITGDSKCKTSSLDNLNTKSSLSGSEDGQVLLSSTDVSTPTRGPNDSKSPTVVLKKRVLSSQKKEQRAKVKEQLEKKKQEKKFEKANSREEKLAQKKKIQQERLSLQLKKKQKKEEELQLKKKQKEEERAKKEEERAKKEEERAKKEEKKEEERQKKEEERLKKEEERQKKEEERQKKEEERQRREEEKKKEEEEEQKKKEKAAAAFASFFLPRKSVQSKNLEEQKVEERKFMPFMVKGDMRLAPVVRGHLKQQDKEKIDMTLSQQSVKKLYLDELKEKLRCPKTCSATWSLSELKEDVVIIDEEDIPPGGNGGAVVLDTHQDMHLRAKLLQFCENQRPPYWGTWRKRSKTVGPRCPFQKDDKYFDYEVDSDDEWEEEEPGESLHGSDDEKESEDEYEVDNEFFVPHGYLSNEEADGEEEENVSPEIQKAKLKLLGIEFEEEMKQQTKQIKPQLLGCFWSFGKTVDENLNHKYEKIFMPYKAVICCESIPTSFMTNQNNSMIGTISGGQTDGSSVGRKKSVFPEAAIPDLIRLVHGNTTGWRFLVVEFLTHWKKKNDVGGVTKEKEGEMESPASSKSAISKLSISRKIKELGSWTQFPEGSVLSGKYAWFVTEETRAQFGLSDLSLPNSWQYNLKPVKKSEVKSAPPSTSPSGVTCEVSVESPNSSSTKPHLITKFTKVMSKEERLKQLKQTLKTSGGPQGGLSSIKKQESKVAEVATTSTSEIANRKPNPIIANSTDAKARKRVPLLVSVPRGQEIPKSYSLASFLKQPGAPKDSSSSFSTTDQVKADENSEKLSCADKKDDIICVVLD